MTAPASAEPEGARAVAVRCRGISKAYGTGDARVSALREADLDVLAGEMLLLVGPSGSGKTTLISVITGLLAQDEGACSVFGQDVRAMDATRAARFRAATVGFVFQAFNLLPALTARENVSLPLLMNGVPRLQAEARATAALDQVGLAARASSLPSQLSGGQQQRVGIARAIVHEPRLIVCDEPTSNLDHATGKSVMEILHGIARRPDRSIIVVTHDPRIHEYGDRIARMDDGRIVDVASGDEGEAQLP